jgi:hypothetical protein
VTVHQHLDGTVSIRFGPHVVGRYDAEGQPLAMPAKGKRGGKDGSMEAGENQKAVSTGSHTPLEISQKARDSHFSTAPMTTGAPTKAKIKSAKNKEAA